MKQQQPPKPPKKQQYQLKKAVYSSYHKKTYGKNEDPRIVYGKAFDMVKIVSDHGNVQIVEGRDGSRFPVQTTNLREV